MKVFRILQGRLKVVSKKFFSRVFERSSKGILEKFQRCVKKVSRVFKESF